MDEDHFVGALAIFLGIMLVAAVVLAISKGGDGTWLLVLFLVAFLSAAFKNRS